MLNGLHVLLVEDEAATRRGVQGVLEQCRATVTSVESAAAAQAAYAASLDDGVSFDVLISDIAMPDGDG